jgi:5'-nucleotidase (lipoprotein e(P4) family)
MASLHRGGDIPLMTMHAIFRRAALAVCALALAAPLGAQAPAAAPPEATRGLEIKWVRESIEYATLTRMVYRMATGAVEVAAPRLPAGRWTVVLDIDETTLDNSDYFLERAAYGQPFDDSTWDAWMARRAARAVPGVQEFVATVRRLGGRVAYITDRRAAAREDTRANLLALGLIADGDLLCLRSSAGGTKRERRTTLTAGAGACAWPNEAMTVAAYVGDQLGDFPGPEEPDADAGADAGFGRRFFLLPDPMYGSWTRRPTRDR